MLEKVVDGKRVTMCAEESAAIEEGWATMTDDTATIQAALDTGVVDLPAGIYMCGPLTGPAGLILEGNGTIKLTPGSTGAILTFADASGVRISGVTFDGDHANNPLGTKCVHITGGSSAFTFDRVTFANAKTVGLHQAGAYTGGGRVTNCLVKGNQTDGLIFEGDDMVASGNLCRSNGRFGILVTGNRALITGNQCKSNGKVVHGGAGIGVVGGGKPVVTGNYCYDNGDIASTLFSHGIQFNGVANGTMAGNVSTGNSGSGLDFYNSPYGSCTGNQSTQNGVRGIEVDTGSTYTTVSANVARLNAEIGISVYNTVGVTVANNVVENNGTLGQAYNPMTGANNLPRGISLHGAGNYGNHASILGNRIVGNVGSGANGVGLWVDPACIAVMAKDNQFAGNTVSKYAVAGNFSVLKDNPGW